MEKELLYQVLERKLHCIRFRNGKNGRKIFRLLLCELRLKRKKLNTRLKESLSFSGHEMFEFNPELVAMDDEGADDTCYMVPKMKMRKKCKTITPAQLGKLICLLLKQLITLEVVVHKFL